MTVKTSLMQGLCVRVGVNEWMVTHVNTHENMAGVLTKPLMGGEKIAKFHIHDATSCIWNNKWRLGSTLF